MVLALPPQPADPRVILPVVPNDPPTLEDINNAIDFRKTVTDSSRKYIFYRLWILGLLTTVVFNFLPGSNEVNASTAEDVARAAVYEIKVIKGYIDSDADEKSK